MGYDCTFHLVDEKAIRDQFVPKLLGKADRPTPLEEVYGDEAADLWANVRRALNEGLDDEGEEMDDEGVASVVCQLALMYSACTLPHHYERGWAFSLWPEEEVGFGFPAGFAHSPEPLFEEVVRKYPRLHGHFPDWITGNYSTGVYVQASRVAEVRRWLETSLAPLPKGKQRDYRGLLALLRSAEDRGLAYWEATDLAVPMANQVPGNPDLMTADFLGNTPGGTPPAEKFALPGKGHRNRVGGRGDWHVLSQAIPDATWVPDLGQWPPALYERGREFVWAVDADRDGRWLFVSRQGTGNQNEPVRGRVLADPRGEAQVTLHVEQDGREVKVIDGFLVAGRVVLVPDVGGYKAGAELSAWMQEGPAGARMVPAPGLPPHVVREGRFGKQRIVKGVARLAGGSEVLVWDGDGYEWDGRQFRRTFPLALTDGYKHLSAVPAGDDGFYFLATAGEASGVFEARRGREPVRHLPGCNNVMALMPGPAGGLLVKEGDNDDGDVGKLYFPADGTFIHIEPQLLGDKDLYDFLCFSAGAGRIVASDSYNFYAAPVEAVMGMPRFDARTGREVGG